MQLFNNFQHKSLNNGARLFPKRSLWSFDLQGKFPIKGAKIKFCLNHEGGATGGY